MGDERRVVLFCGGGTVGHLAPGFALADELSARGLPVAFATPGEESERTWFEGREPPWTLPATRLPRSLGAKLLFPGRFWGNLRAAKRLLREKQVGCVVALGGWPSAPAAFAARTTRVPLVFLVPDAVPGVVVRRLAKRAGRLYLALGEAADHLPAHAGVRVTGPLLRRAALEGRRDPAAFALDEGKRTLFVTGGSLGALRLYERFLDGLEQAVRHDASLVERVQVIHAEGRSHGGAAERYAALGVTHHVTPYVHAMGTAYATADLVLCRAGASTCAELLATRTPAVLVPYPHHADRQQFRNADGLVRAGGARLVEQASLDPEAVRREVLDLLGDEPRLARMRAALAVQEQDAVAETADDLVRFLGWEAAAPAVGQAPDHR